MRFLVVLMILLPFIFLSSSCGPSNVDSRTVYQKEGRYPQNFKTPIALFVRERNGSPHIMASAFLIDKQRGFFASAKHFVGSDSDGECKIFFNGRVYNGFLLKLPPITDIAVITIEGGFDSSDFPEPYGIAREVRVGDAVFVRGIHPHAKQHLGNNTIIPIYKKYYGLLTRPDDLIYENLEAQVVRLDNVIVNKDIGGVPETVAEISNTYISLRTVNDHKFTFGGLSGGPSVNERNELIGIISNQLPLDRILPGTIELTERGVIYHPWNTINVVPATEIEKLRPYLENTR